jgi:5-methylcytosine-specific restriction endonuclease McrA
MGRSDTIMPELTPQEQTGLAMLKFELNILFDKIEVRRQNSKRYDNSILNDTYHVTHQFIVDHIAALPISRRPVLATAIYWLYDDEIARFALSEALGVSAASLTNHLYRFPRIEHCYRCGNDAPTLRNSWDELRDETLCLNCRAVEQVPSLNAIPYREYLQTDHWRETREYALIRADYRCQVCNSSAGLHVHHRTYARRGEELPSDVIVLCADCHKLFHENRKLARGE